MERGYAAEAPPPNAAMVVKDDRVHHGFTWTPGYRNVRVPVQEPIQEAPDPIRQGATPSRQPRVQVATFAYDMGAMFGAEDFIPADVFLAANRRTLPGGMAPWSERANTAPPQHVAYGSLFQYDPVPYGYG